MTDDIVTRLREINVRYVLKDELFLTDALTEAADEIERLRKERDQFDTAFPTNKNYITFIHPDAKRDA